VQKVLIIGAGGIGSAIAKSIVASGGNVFIAGRTQGSLETQASALGCEFGLVEATNATSVDQCGDQAFAALDGLTGIVNCVGSILLKPAHLTSPRN
jgi:saccharopine dehydrogenase-like NADP-dependent oxidoreductase